MINRHWKSHKQHQTVEFHERAAAEKDSHNLPWRKFLLYIFRILCLQFFWWCSRVTNLPLHQPPKCVLIFCRRLYIQFVVRIEAQNMLRVTYKNFFRLPFVSNVLLISCMQNRVKNVVHFGFGWSNWKLHWFRRV